MKRSFKWEKLIWGLGKNAQEGIWVATSWLFLFKAIKISFQSSKESINACSWQNKPWVQGKNIATMIVKILKGFSK